MTKRLAFLLAVALGACAGSGGSGHVQYAAAVTVRSPQLVPVEDVNGVYVLADADEPVFYADNYYWLYRSGRWYRSHSYDRDWIYVSSPAPRLRSIRQPTAYVRYNVRLQEARNTPPGSRDTYRDYDRERSDAPGTLPPHQQPPLQPTEPQQPVQPYPRPPQQESPVDHHITPGAPAKPTPPGTSSGTRLDIRGDVDVDADGNVPTPPPSQVDRTRTEPGNRPVVPPGQTHRPSLPPGQDRGHDVRTPGQTTDTPPGQTDRPATPPGQTKRDVRAPGQTDRPATPPGQTDRPATPPGQSEMRDDKRDDRGRANTRDDKARADKARDDKPRGNTRNDKARGNVRDDQRSGAPDESRGPNRDDTASPPGQAQHDHGKAQKTDKRKQEKAAKDKKRDY